MFDHDGSRFFGDPRWLLEQQLASFATLGLTPVVAIEYEFYLVDAQRGARWTAATAARARSRAGANTAPRSTR